MKQGVWVGVSLALGLMANQSVLAREVVSIDAKNFADIAEGWSGLAELNYAGASGNSDYSYLASSLSVQHKHNSSVNLVSLARNYGESSGTTNRDNQFAHLRHVEFLNEHRAWEVFAQFQSDAFKQLNARYLLGAGMRFDVPLAQGFSSYGIGLMGEREELDDGTATERGRLASYAKHQLTLSESANINNSLYYQPDLEDFSNYRITDDVQLSSSITEKLSLSVKLTYLFNSQPPVGVKKTDWIYSTGLKYAF